MIACIQVYDPNDVFIAAAMTLKEANIRDNKLNTLPIVDKNGHLVSFVFARIMIPHAPDELLDSKRYMVGANTVTMRLVFLCLLRLCWMFCARLHLRVTRVRSARLSTRATYGIPSSHAGNARC